MVDKASTVYLNADKRKKCWLYLLGVNAGKAEIMRAVQVGTPGPRYMHYPKGRGYDEKYYRGLLSERLIYRGKKFQWEPIPGRPRNEPLDIRNYNLAAFSALDVDLLIVMVIDYIMGFLIAWKDHDVKSRKMHEGLVRKIGYIALVVAVDVVAGVLMKDGRGIRDAVIIGFLFNEFISLLEHINVLGIKTPKALDPLLKHLASHSENKKKENKEEHEKK